MGSGGQDQLVAINKLLEHIRQFIVAQARQCAQGGRARTRSGGLTRRANTFFAGGAARAAGGGLHRVGAPARSARPHRDQHQTGPSPRSSRPYKDSILTCRGCTRRSGARVGTHWVGAVRPDTTGWRADPHAGGGRDRHDGAYPCPHRADRRCLPRTGPAPGVFRAYARRAPLTRPFLSPPHTRT